MTSRDIIKHEKIGFDSKKYVALQKQALTERLNHFSNGILYLEIGGKFLFDAHAQRVLPGFDPTCKTEIIKSLGITFDVIYCINAQDLADNRMLTTEQISYRAFTLKSIEEYAQALGVKPKIAINLVNGANIENVKQYQAELEQLGYASFKRFMIAGYPQAEKILSSEGYGKDEYIRTDAKLVLVIGPASNSGKMSTCLGQIYHDIQHKKESGYAKYELFPIWNLPLNHPVNLAYEAATVDIGDYNEIDPFHMQAYGKEAVNYNRDIAAFPIVYNLAQKLGSSDNFMHTYKSPTDMGMNMAGFAITDDGVVSRAAIAEIHRRKMWFTKQKEEGKGKAEWIEKCEEIYKKAKQ